MLVQFVFEWIWTYIFDWFCNSLSPGIPVNHTDTGWVLSEQLDSHLRSVVRPQIEAFNGNQKWSIIIWPREFHEIRMCLITRYLARIVGSTHEWWWQGLSIWALGKTQHHKSGQSSWTARGSMPRSRPHLWMIRSIVTLADFVNVLSPMLLRLEIGSFPTRMAYHLVFKKQLDICTNSSLFGRNWQPKGEGYPKPVRFYQGFGVWNLGHSPQQPMIIIECYLSSSNCLQPVG